MFSATRASTKVGARVAARGAVVASSRQAALNAVRTRNNAPARSIQSIAQTDRVC
jgi:hypothetical protein